MFQVKLEWVEANRTDAGGFTKAQLTALGIKWPPQRGWIGRMLGKTISESQKEAFENGKYVKRVEKDKGLDRREIYFPGGVYDTKDECRTDVMLQACTVDPPTVQLTFVTGNGTITLVEISLKSIRELSNWLAATAYDLIG